MESHGQRKTKVPDRYTPQVENMADDDDNREDPDLGMTSSDESADESPTEEDKKFIADSDDDEDYVPSDSDEEEDAEFTDTDSSD